MDRTGRVESAVEQRGFLICPRFSPDGSRIAAILPEGGANNVWILDLRRGTFSRLTTEGAGDGFLWSSDGDWIVFSSEGGATGLDVFRQRADGSGPAEVLLERDNAQYPESWSRDGEWLVYRDIESFRGRLGALRLGRGEAETLPESLLGEWSASLSPDGRFLAYPSKETGRAEIYVRSFPGPGPKWPISTNGGMFPVWSPDGSEIFFENDRESAILAVQVRTSPDFEASRPEVLFLGAYVMGGFSRSWDVSPDGKRFAMNRAYVLETATHVTLNWFDELERLAPRR